ncbi:sulfotransferase family 2 domain-containing protein [Paracoccus homiensis]|uniref:sulfotransferase family 2 domain-containing protein n=1 Tax=Paracoccus homiensis TaxID=364199 RepID=UPI00398D516A
MTDLAAAAGHSVFFAPPLRPGPANAQAEQFATAHADTFADPEAAAQFLRSIHMPASGRWAFLNNGKAGTSSARRLLFRLEFGVPLTTEWDMPQDINPDSVVHHMQATGWILRPVLTLKNGPARLQKALRIATVRHPTERVLSAFDYLCQSHDLRHSWFAADRLRMNATVGFDWTRHPRTAEGLARFLAYVELTRDKMGPAAIDPHWRPQIDNIRPDIYRPDILGRVEDMPGFCHQVADRLGHDLPDDFAAPKANSQARRSDRADLLTPANRHHIGQLYAEDFGWLGYDPDQPS